MKLPRFTRRGFKRPREVSPPLGKLEVAVMNEAWRRGEASVRDIHQAFDESLAYTTLMTTLDRLYKKGLLARRKECRAYLYAPRVSRSEFELSIAGDVLDGLLDRQEHGVEPVLACIVDAVSERDRRLLDELERLVQRKQLELMSRE